MQSLAWHPEGTHEGRQPAHQQAQASNRGRSWQPKLKQRKNGSKHPCRHICTTTHSLQVLSSTLPECTFHTCGNTPPSLQNYDTLSYSLPASDHVAAIISQPLGMQLPASLSTGVAMVDQPIDGHALHRWWADVSRLCVCKGTRL